MENKNIPEVRFQRFNGAWEQREWVNTVDISTNMVDPRIEIYHNLPHIGPGNIESFSGSLYSNVKSVKDDNLISGKFHFNKGDVIYGKINPQLGKYVLAPFEGLSSADAYVLNAKDGLDQTFLFYLIQTNDFFKYSVSVSMRSGMPKINRNELNEYKFLAPSLQEQNHIGKFLLVIDQTISLQQQELTILKQTKQGFLQKMFPKEGEAVPKVRFAGFTGDWVQYKLGDIFKILDGDRGKNYPGESDFYKTGETLFLDTGNVKKNGFNFLSKKYITKEKDESLRNGKLELYDFVLTSRGTLGNVAYYDENVRNINPSVRINSAMLILRPIINNKVSNNYIESVLRGNIIDKYMLTNRVGSAQPHITKGDFSKVSIGTPATLKEQSQIGNFFKQLDEVITLHEQELEALQQTKKAFLQKMFV